jgi:hypothetical protein
VEIFAAQGAPPVANWFQGINSASICSLAGRYDNRIPTRFLALIDCLKIPAQDGAQDRDFAANHLAGPTKREGLANALPSTFVYG